MSADLIPLDRRRPRTPWRGGALMGAGWATFAGAVGDNRDHAHHALQLVVGEAADVVVWIRGRGEVQAPAVLLDADVVHRLALGPVLAALGQDLPAVPPAEGSDDRVQRVLDSLVTRTTWEGTLTTLAAEAAISPSRFRHRVRELIGMPLRPYLRWLRLRRALTVAATGESLTRAAQDAGFADAAHLTRTMQRHFGVAPSDVIQALRQGV